MSTSSAAMGCQLRPVADALDGRICRMMREIKSKLEQQAGHSLSYETLGEYAGLAGSTVFDSLYRPNQKQVKGVIRFLELLPGVRGGILERACRCLPSLTHSRLAHDPTQISWLKTLLQQQSGLTVIQGADAGARTFLIAALGHASKQKVTGIDVHHDDWFVGVKGVSYLSYAPRERIQLAWQSVQACSAKVVLLNGVWHGLPDLDIRKLTKRCHVIVADELQLRPDGIQHFSPPWHILQLSIDRADRIRVAIKPG